MQKIKVWLEFPAIDENYNAAKVANSINGESITVLEQKCTIHTINSEDDEDGDFIDKLSLKRL